MTTKKLHRQQLSHISRYSNDGVPVPRKTAYTCKFIYPSTETRYPLYSIPHFNFTITGLPVKPLRNGFGFSGIACSRKITQNHSKQINKTHIIGFKKSLYCRQNQKYENYFRPNVIQKLSRVSSLQQTLHYQTTSTDSCTGVSTREAVDTQSVYMHRTRPSTSSADYAMPRITCAAYAVHCLLKAAIHWPWRAKLRHVATVSVYIGLAVRDWLCHLDGSASLQHHCWFWQAAGTLTMQTAARCWSLSNSAPCILDVVLHAGCRRLSAGSWIGQLWPRLAEKAKPSSGDSMWSSVVYRRCSPADWTFRQTACPKWCPFADESRLVHAYTYDGLPQSVFGSFYSPIATVLQSWYFGL